MNIMKRRLLLQIMLLLAVVCTAWFVGQRSLKADGTPFEVWATDQSGTGGKLYIYNGADLNDNAATALPEVIDLNGAVSALCLEQTGSAPVRAHMLAFNPAH